jgi:hypothetical protein
MLALAWRFVTLLLAALTLGMASVHRLEMPAKLRYPASLWGRSSAACTGRSRPPGDP